MTTDATDYKEGGFADEPSTRVPTNVHVIAPSTLTEGYAFDVEVGPEGAKTTISAEVPAGGVAEGQVFLVPLPSDFGVGEAQVDVPTGSWKDGPFDLINAGFCHPSVWCGICFTQVAMAQVMQRLRLNWLGSAAPDAATKSTFKVVLALVVCYTIFTVALEVAESTTGYYTTWIPTLRFLGGLLFTVYSVYSLMRTRGSVRAKYSIPEERCAGMEDLCCSLWCSCCVVSQMARHTGDYDNYAGRFCSETGMAAHTPSIV